MTIPLYDVIAINYTAANCGIGGNVQLADHGDGNGPIINIWNVPNVSQPTAEQLAAFQTDANTIAQYTFQQNAITNTSVLAQLDTIDAQSIRALREPGTASTAKLNTLTTQAAALRAQLLPTS